MQPSEMSSVLVKRPSTYPWPMHQRPQGAVAGDDGVVARDGDRIELDRQLAQSTLKVVAKPSSVPSRVRRVIDEVLRSTPAIQHGIAKRAVAPAQAPSTTSSPRPGRGPQGSQSWTRFGERHTPSVAMLNKTAQSRWTLRCDDLGCSIRADGWSVQWGARHGVSGDRRGTGRATTRISARPGRPAAYASAGNAATTSTKHSSPSLPASPRTDTSPTLSATLSP
jgi:hypothetical protein